MPILIWTVRYSEYQGIGCNAAEKYFFSESAARKFAATEEGSEVWDNPVEDDDDWAIVPAGLRLF